MNNYLKIIRLPNLAMITLMQLLARYAFLKPQGLWLALADWQYALLVLATVLLAAAGYVINDILDQATDAINKPGRVIVGKKISEEHAYYYYAALNITGVVVGFYLSNVIAKPGFAALFILVAALLYFYATTLKQMPVIGNLAVALVLAFSLLIVVVFDVFPATYDGNRKAMANASSVLFDYAVFAFAVNFLRELVKDLEDVNGDYNQGMRTLPIVLGVQRTARLAFALTLIPLAALLYYVDHYFFENGLYFATLYGLVLVAAPLIYAAVQLWTAKTKKDFAHLSLVFKLVILFGILSMGVVSFNILYHATHPV